MNSPNQKSGSGGRAALAWALALGLASAWVAGLGRMAALAPLALETLLGFAALGLLGLAFRLPGLGPRRPPTGAAPALFAATCLLALGALGGAAFWAGSGGGFAWGPALLWFLLAFLPAELGWGWTLLGPLGRDSLPLALVLPAAGLAGMALTAFTGLLLASLGALRLALALPLALGWILLAFNLKSLAGRAGAWLARGRVGPPDRVSGLLAWALVLAWLAWLAACLVPSTGWDALSSYLLIPRYWIASGRVCLDPFQGNTGLPPFGFALGLQALLAGFEQVAKLHEWACLVYAALAAWWMGARMGGRRAGPLAALVFSCLPLGFSILQDGMVDYLQAALVACAVAVSLLSLEALEDGGAGARPGRLALLAGLLFGFSFCVKPQAPLYPFCLLLAALLVRPGRARQRGFRRALGLLVLGMVAACLPLALESAAVQGRVLGFLSNALGVADPAAAFMIQNPALLGWKGLWARFTFQILEPQHLGPLLPALAPLGLLAWLRGGGAEARRPLPEAHLFGLLALLACLAVTAEARWFLPLFPWASALAALGLVSLPWQRAWWVAPALGMQALGLLAPYAPALASFEPYLLGGQGRAAFLDGHVAGASELQAADALARGRSRILLYGETRGFLLRSPTVFGDPVWRCAAFDYSGVRSWKDLLSRCRDLGIGYFLVNYGLGATPSAHPLRLRYDPLWRQLLERRGRMLFDRGGISFYSLNLAAKGSAK